MAKQETKVSTKDEAAMKESIEKGAQTRKQKFLKAISGLKFRLKKARDNTYFKNSIYNDGGELVEECVENYRADCASLKKAIEEYIEAEKAGKKTLKSKIGQKLNLGLKLDENKLNDLKKEIKEPTPSDKIAPENAINDIAEKMANLRKSIKPTSTTNKNLRKKLAEIEKQLESNATMMTNDSNARLGSGIAIEEVEKKAKTRKKEFLKKIENLDFSYEPKNNTILDSKGEATKAVREYRENCKELAKAINEYVESEQKDENSTKFKVKSLLSLKLNLGKMKALKKELTSENCMESTNGQTVTLTCLEVKELMEKFRKSIAPTSAANKEIREKFASFEKQLRSNMKIWRNDPQHPDNIAKN